MEINLIKEKAEKFDAFYSLLKEENEKYNLTAITEKEEVYLKHFIDSLKAVDKFGKLSTVIEIGSGAGFPSIPLMIVREDLKFTLLESSNKKCNFLLKAKKLLGLNCEIVCGRAEEYALKKEFREVFDFSTARAVARLNTLCEYSLPFVKVGGKFIAYKGDADEELKEAENAIELLGGKVVSADKYFLGEDMKREIIEIEKVKKTPPIYPRGRGLERKNPL